jgi:hypothetical protein
MRRAVAFADLAIFTVPPEKLSWRPKVGPRVAFVPVGANLPIPPEIPDRAAQVSVPTIAVFSITGGEKGEPRLILHAVRHAAENAGELRLSVFGRHAELRERDLRNGLRGLPVEISVEGVIDPPQVVARFLACDVLLFVRGVFSPRQRYCRDRLRPSADCFLWVGDRFTDHGSRRDSACAGRGRRTQGGAGTHSPRFRISCGASLAQPCRLSSSFRVACDYFPLRRSP